MAIFKVTRADAAEGEKPRMIEAANAGKAISFAAASTFSAEKVTTKEALSLSQDGVKLEDASAAPEPAATPETSPEPNKAGTSRPTPATVAAKAAASAAAEE